MEYNYVLLENECLNLRSVTDMVKSREGHWMREDQDTGDHATGKGSPTWKDHHEESDWEWLPSLGNGVCGLHYVKLNGTFACWFGLLCFCNRGRKNRNRNEEQEGSFSSHGMRGTRGKIHPC